MRTARFAIATVAVVVAFGIPGQAASNLLPNPRFNRDLAGWTPGDVFSTTATYAAGTDRDGAFDSGSARVAAIAQVPFTFGDLTSGCLPVTAGKIYRWRADVLVPAGQDPTGGVQPGLKFSTSPTCATLEPPTYYLDNSLNFSPAVGTWLKLTGQGPAPAGMVAARLELANFEGSAGTALAAFFDNVEFAELGCGGLESDSTLCLQGGRFAVTADWQTSTSSGTAGAVQLTGDTGYFWFFNPSNVEVVVKVLNACVNFQRYWSFSAGLTNVQVDLTVVDTATGTTKVYHNPLNTSYPPKLDTNAFATCP